MMRWDGMTVYPSDHTRLGKHMLPNYARHHIGDTPMEDLLVITLMDAWTLIDPRFGGVLDTSSGFRLASWVPIDHDPAPPRVLKALEDIGSRPIAMSRFGQDRLRAQGLDALYVPHGVDTNVLCPHPEWRDDIREANQIPQDAFVIGMVANNAGNGPPRKAFPQVFQAFSLLCQERDDVYLYLHAEPLGLSDGVNLFALAEATGIPEDRVRIVDQYKYLTGGISPTHMAGIYNMIDVLAMPSYGEGFGVPLIEAQACGTPVITTDWTAMPELVGAGWTVQGDRWYNSAHGSFFMCPNVFEILDAFQHAYEARGDQGIAESARAFALQYDVDVVMRDYWLPVLAELEPASAKKSQVAIPAPRRVRRAEARKKVTA